MKTTFGVLITLSALLPLLTAQGVDLTLQRESSGSDVVRAAVNRIQAVLSFDRQLLRRIAFVESRDGKLTRTRIVPATMEVYGRWTKINF